MKKITLALILTLILITSLVKNSTKEIEDLIFIKRVKGNKHKISFNGRFSKNIKKNNTINSLFKILDDKNLLHNKKFQINVKKNIPQEAGLGGGSMNAATILNFLIEKKFIKINQKKILQITNLIGSDVILGINPTSTILSSNGAVKRFLKTSSFYTLLVRPNFGCSTKKIYSGVKKFSKPVLNNPNKNMLNLRFLLKYENELEKVAFSKYQNLEKLKLFLEKLNQPLFVRMTGSGSVLVAYYQRKRDCELAKVKFKRKFKNYWCNTSKTI